MDNLQDIDFIKQVKYIRDELRITRIIAIRAKLKENNTNSLQKTSEILKKVRQELHDIRAKI